MNSNHEELIFGLAVTKTGAERAEFLGRECAGDPALRQRLERLLAAHEQPDDLLAPSAEPVRTIKLELEDAPDESIGQKVGRYKILERVGEGGCGVVYVAEQTEPVRRRVALKVIKLGMDTKQVVARFEAERQALAMMDHPNIAKVLDAGTTDVGRPYFVMELVRGIRITDYCDQAQLSTKERLDLFIKVCQAIQHAHQKGIIHRDIKPSNILVTLHDGVPVPKVIDFGIAKATEGRLTDATVYTQLNQFIGTPAYMSPEQAEMSGLDIDTRSDIYSLGVLLYELLAGSTPFDGKELMSLGIDAMRKTIREKEPQRPSTKLSQTLVAADVRRLKSSATDTPGSEEEVRASSRRLLRVKETITALRGDLDWIVMKCLEKDRTRRYDTANGLAADLKRHLNNEPVTARPPSTAYRFQKAFRRNKLVFATSAAVAAALLLGIIGSTWQAVRAKRAEALALQSRGDAEKLSNFLLDDFYAELEPSGQFATLARLARRAVAYYDNLPTSLRTPETARNRALAQARLALVVARQGDFKSAMPIAQEAEATLERMRQQGGQSDGTVYALGLALEAEYWCYRVQGDWRSSAEPLQQGAEILRSFANSAEGSRRAKLQYANLLNYLSHAQSPEQGVATCEEALHILAGLGALDLSDLSAASAWADTADSEAREALEIGRLDDAERLEQQVQTLAEGVIARHPGDLRARLDLSLAPDVLALIAARRFHDADALRLATQFRQADEEYLRFNPSDEEGWIMLAEADYSIAALLFRQGRVAEALQQARTEAQTNRSPSLQETFLLESAIACWEAQRGNGGAAEQVLQAARGSLAAYASRSQMTEVRKANFAERLDEAERQMRLAFGKDATVYTMATNALPRLVEIRRNVFSSDIAAIVFLQRQTLDEAAQAALNLGHYADAETAAHALLSLPSETGEVSELTTLGRPDDPVWGQVFLAQAESGQNREAEALKTLEPALAHYHDMQAQGTTYLAFRWHFARALYVQALAEPADSDGIARRRAALAQATALLQGLTAEARQLHDTKQLLSWIAAAQKKTNQDTKETQP